MRPSPLCPTPAGTDTGSSRRRGTCMPSATPSTTGNPGRKNVPVTAAARTADGGGYWLLFSNGAVAAFGDAKSLGDPVGSVGARTRRPPSSPRRSGAGYWIASANGAVYGYGDAPNDGSMAGQHLNGSIVAATGW